MKPPPLPPLELPEIQGLLASGYGKQAAASFLVLRVTDSAAARRWLGTLVPHLTFCGDRGGGTKLNLAFSHRGLARMGCPEPVLTEFSREFREGMVTPHRQRVLGDLEGSASDPQTWRWGGRDRDAVDALLAVYEETAPALQATLARLRSAWSGIEEHRELPTIALDDGREHFGFRDGFAQPAMRGFERRDAAARDLVAPGEFILGYPDDSGANEPAHAWARNGSYLVVRQLVQDVPGFWSALCALAPSDAVTLAAKMVGRWPDGTPLPLSSCPMEPSRAKEDFGYADDVAGLRCPLGAHIRRANPRNGLFDDSTRMVNRHRLLRRGRAFGRPLPSELYPAGCAVTASEGAGAMDEPRGLYFACLNASLSRQFEFVQQTWLNNPKFHGLANETDALAATARWFVPGEPAVFTQQGKPLRHRVPWPQTFVSVVGGEYFFLPGRRALRQLAGDVV